MSGFDDQGNTVELSPFAIGDLNDADNNHLLYFDQSIIPQTLFLPEGLVIDPNGDANPSTTVNIVLDPNPISFFDPLELDVFRGTLLEGDLAAVAGSDNVFLKLNPGFTLNDTEAPVWLVFDGNVVNDLPTSLGMVVESRVDTPGLTKTIELFNWGSQQFEVVDSRSGSFNTDETVELDLSNDVFTYLQRQSAEIRARVGWRQTGFTINFPWLVCVDQVNWLTRN